METSTRDQLKDQYKSADETLRKTLKASGFDTTLNDYPADEIDRYFKPARELIDAKKATYEQVEAWATNARAQDSERAGRARGEPDVDYEGMFEIAEDLDSSIIEGMVEAVMPQMSMRFAYRYVERLMENRNEIQSDLESRLNEAVRSRMRGLRGRSLGLPSGDDRVVDVDSSPVDDD